MRPIQRDHLMLPVIVTEYARPRPYPLPGSLPTEMIRRQGRFSELQGKVFDTVEKIFFFSRLPEPVQVVEGGSGASRGRPGPARRPAGCSVQWLSFSLLQSGGGRQDALT